MRERIERIEENAGEDARKMRPDWDTYFILIAMMAATRSTCLRRQVGAVITRGRQIISTGYNGAPSKTAHCLEK